MKIQSYLLVGAGLFLAWKIGQKLHGNKQPLLTKTVDNSDKANTFNKQAPLVSVASGSSAGTGEGGADVTVIGVLPVADRSIFPANVYEKFAVKESGESVKTYTAD